MSTHTACPRPPAAPLLHLARPGRDVPPPAGAERVSGLFDRLFEAWAERAHHLWRDRGWCRGENAPYL